MRRKISEYLHQNNKYVVRMNSQIDFSTGVSSKLLMNHRQLEIVLSFGRFSIFGKYDIVKPIFLVYHVNEQRKYYKRHLKNKRHL